MASLTTVVQKFDAEIGKVLRLQPALISLDVQHQKLMAELLLLRVFSVYEEAMAEIFHRIIAGHSYCDGTLPVLLHQETSIQKAESAVLNFNRRKPLRYSKWTTDNDIHKNCCKLIDATDHSLNYCNQYFSGIDEIRFVRNHIAHGTRSTRKNYRNVVNLHYGAYRNAVTPGTLLITSRFSPPLLNQYALRCRVFIRDLCKV
jgi:hypothetical protein